MRATFIRNTAVGILVGSLAIGGCSLDSGSPASFGGGGGGGRNGNSNVGSSDAGTGGSSFSDAGSPGSFDGGTPPGNTNINLGGAQDFGYFRALLDNNEVPRPEQFESAGFFAEHHSPLPEPSCGERICLQAMLGVMGNLMNGENCTMLQLGLNSPIVADPNNRPPLNLAVVIDTSGSMRDGNKIGFVREGLEILIDSLTDEDQIAIITYATRAETRFQMQRVGGNRHNLRAIARQLAANGGTNLFEGLRQGYVAVQDAYDSGRQNRVILLSDGNPTQGVTHIPDIISMSGGFNSEGLGITTVGLGTDFNLNLMRGLAEQGDGNFYFLENSSAVDEVFREEISYFTVPVAFDVELTLTATGAFEYRRAFGSRLWGDSADGSGGGIGVPSVFLAHRISHDDVTPGPDGMGRRGGGSALIVELMPRIRADDGSGVEEVDVAVVDVVFREPGTDRIINDRVVVRYPLAPWITPTAGVWDGEHQAIVQKSFVMLNIYVALEQSTTLFHSGQGSEAIGMLRRLIAAVQDYHEDLNGGEGDTDMRLDIELMEQLIEVMIQNGARDPDVPDIPPDPWPAD